MIQVSATAQATRSKAARVAAISIAIAALGLLLVASPGKAGAQATDDAGLAEALPGAPRLNLTMQGRPGESFEFYSNSIDDPTTGERPGAFAMESGATRSFVSDRDFWLAVPDGRGFSILPGRISQAFVTDVECDAPSELEPSRYDDYLVLQVQDVPRGAEVNCTIISDPSTSVTVTADAGADSTTAFRYGLYARYGTTYFTLRGGESRTISVPPGYDLGVFLRSPAGWTTTPTCSTATGPLAAMFDPYPGTTVTALADGQTSTCTMTNTPIGSATLTIDVQTDGAISGDFRVADQLGPYGDTRFLAPGSRTLSFNADDPIGLTLYPPKEPQDVRYFNEPGDCTNADGTEADGVTIEPYGITGSLQDGDEVTCTYTVYQEQLISIAVDIELPNGEVAEGFTLQSGSTIVPLPGTWVTETNHRVGSYNQGIYGIYVVSPDHLPTGASCSADSGLTYSTSVDIRRGGEIRAVLSGTPNPALDAISCTIFMRDVSDSLDAYPTVTCLGGNGRIDMNVINTTDVGRNMKFIVGTIERTGFVQPGDWWRTPVTGRADGEIRARVFRSGVQIFDKMLTVDCDSETPTVTTPEVQVIPACRGGNGFVAFQISNPRASSSSYVVYFEGVANRSTTAAGYGASVRGVSGRPDGTYRYYVRANGAGYATIGGNITIDCDD